MPYVEYDEVEAVCAECGRIFRSEEALERHTRESHLTLVPRPPPAKGGKPREPSSTRSPNDAGA